MTNDDPSAGQRIEVSEQRLERLLQQAGFPKPLDERLAKIEGRLEKLSSGHDRKDSWDKFGTLSPIIGGLLLAVVGR